MERIAVIGAGRIGGALGARWALAGETVTFGSRAPDGEKAQAAVARSGGKARVATPREAAEDADIILLAVYATDALAVLGGLGDLSGKIVIDPINAVRRVDGRAVGPVDGTSIAATIQAAFPEVRLVKAFATVASVVLDDPSIVDGPVTIPLAGNDAEARARVGRLVAAAGFEALDVGDISDAALIEAMGLLHIRYFDVNKPQLFEFRLTTYGRG